MDGKEPEVSEVSLFEAFLSCWRNIAAELTSAPSFHARRRLDSGKHAGQQHHPWVAVQVVETRVLLLLRLTPVISRLVDRSEGRWSLCSVRPARSISAIFYH